MGFAGAATAIDNTVIMITTKQRSAGRRGVITLFHQLASARIAPKYRGSVLD